MERDHVDRLTEQWARERPQLDLEVLEIVARVIRLERFIERTSQAAMAEADLTPGELNVLAALRRAGPPFELTPTELYRGLLVSSGAMTNRLDRLEEAGLVHRVPDAEDRRRVRVLLTDAGRALIDRAMDVHVEVLGARLGALSARERHDLRGLLRRALLAFEEAGVE